MRRWQSEAANAAVDDGGKPAEPEWSDEGVPWCAEDKCHHFDGKRCDLTGNRTYRLCGPTIEAMAELLSTREVKQ